MIHNQNEKSEFAKKEKQTIPGINIKQKLTSFYTHSHLQSPEFTILRYSTFLQ